MAVAKVECKYSVIEFFSCSKPASTASVRQGDVREWLGKIDRKFPKKP
jgi:hypothetical protein